MAVSLYKPKHRRADVTYAGPTAPDRLSQASCRPGICPRHDSTAYADSMAEHAAAYDGSYSGIGSTI